jgi:transcriptional regulator with XRE-family HTH domain
MTFGTKLQKLRIEKKMTQKEISNVLEVSQTIYGKWESDIFYPTYKNLKKIANFYMLDVESLTEDKQHLKKCKKSSFLKNVPNLKSSKSIIKLLKKIEHSIFLIREQMEIVEKKK